MAFKWPSNRRAIERSAAPRSRSRVHSSAPDRGSAKSTPPNLVGIGLFARPLDWKAVQIDASKTVLCSVSAACRATSAAKASALLSRSVKRVEARMVRLPICWAKFDWAVSKPMKRLLVASGGKRGDLPGPRIDPKCSLLILGLPPQREAAAGYPAGRPSDFPDRPPQII